MLSVLDQVVLREELIEILMSFGYPDPIHQKIKDELDKIIPNVDGYISEQYPALYQSVLVCPTGGNFADNDRCLIFQNYRKYRILCSWFNYYPMRADEFLSVQIENIQCSNKLTSEISLPDGTKTVNRVNDGLDDKIKSLVKPSNYFCQLTSHYLQLLIPKQKDINIDIIKGR